jgi:hypothetical protein
MDLISKFLDTVKIARKQRHLNLSVFPLLAPEAGEPDYLILEEALKRSLVEVTEVSEEGSVPDLKLINETVEKVSVVSLSRFRFNFTYCCLRVSR